MHKGRRHDDSLETWAAQQAAAKRRRKRLREEAKYIDDPTRDDVSGREYREQRARYDKRTSGFDGK